jgi:histidinol-phosphate aminotransferase
VIRRLRDYYRQFEELSPEEISRGLIERRHAERAQALAEVPSLDLASPAWHEPPDPEAVNAATYALRRAVNAYTDPAPLRDAIATRHGVARDEVAVGHGAGELLRAAFAAIGGEIAVAWPGWGYLPRLIDEAGGTPVAVGSDANAVVVCTPNDPSGEVTDVRALAEQLDEAVWLIVDAALAEFAPHDALNEVVEARERVLVVRSFSKAHAMAGFRIGYAIGREAGRLAPVTGVSAPAQAAALWALHDGDAVVARRRATAARERQRLAEKLNGTPFSFPAGHGHLIWLSSTEHDGATIAAGLAAQRIYVTPGGAWGDDRHVRIALRDGAATDRLSAALRDL